MSDHGGAGRPKQLAYRRPVLCVGHEIAKDARGPEDAEIIIAGYSFCYVCGNAVLGQILDSEIPITAILRMLRDGVIEVTD